MKDAEIHQAVTLLLQAVKSWQSPAVTIVSQRENNAFKVLISCILSLRTQDKTTAAASERLFSMAETPEMLALLPVDVIEKAIYPVGFFRIKAVQIKNICNLLVNSYEGNVPDEIDELLKFRGSAGKPPISWLPWVMENPASASIPTSTAYVTAGGMCRTKTPEQTEQVLRGKLPQEYWLIINDLLVTFGQNQCLPVSPLCTTCPLFSNCERVDVKKSR